MKIKLLTLTLLTSTITSWAQNDPSANNEIELPSIEVVASSKELSTIENLPVSGTVLSPYRLASENIITTADLTARIPNLFMPDYGSKLTSPIFIRGIGSRINAPSVGLYVNGMPFLEKNMYKFDLDNVKRVEVLRGPQGTLYGRNTMGGVINIYTYTPFDKQGTDIRLRGNAFDDITLKVTDYRLINSKLGMMVSAGYNHIGGDFKNITSNEYVGRRNDVNTNLSLEYRPNDLWKLTYAGSFSDSKQKGYPYAPINVTTNLTKDIVYNQEGGYDQLLTTHGLNIQRETKKTLFTSITAFQYLDGEQRLDQDFTADSVNFAVQGQKQLMLSQELVMRSNNDNAKYQWIIGAYGFWQNIKSNVDVDNYRRKTTEYRLNINDTYGAALFHQSRINDLWIRNLSLEAGIRMDTEKSTMDYDYTLKTTDNTTVNPRVSSELDFVKVIPKISLMYNNAGNLLFASLSYGYKTGGFNNTFELESDRSFNPEYSINYELGYRSQRVANLFSLDLSLFYIDWKNQQVYAASPSGRGVLRNAGRSHSTGFEASLNIRPAKDLSFYVDYGYTYAVFDKNKRSENEDYTGNLIPYVPRNTLAVSGLYHINMDSFIDRITLMAQYNGIGKLFWDETNESKQDYYGVFNAQVECRVTSNLKFALFCKNIGNTNYNVFDFKVGTDRFGQRGLPRTFGSSISLFF